MFAFFKKIQNLRKPSKTPVCLGGASREPHLVLSKVVILCSRVTYRSKDKKKIKKREISPLHADVFLAYIPLISRVFGPHGKLRTEFFLHRFMENNEDP